MQVYYDRTDHQAANFAEVRNTFDVDYLERLRLPGRQEAFLGASARAFNRLTMSVGCLGSPICPCNKRTDYLVTGFVQDEIGLVDQRLSLTIGTKLLRTNFTTGVSLEPSARLVWTPDERQTIWAAATHALRTPSDSEEDFCISFGIHRNDGEWHALFRAIQSPTHTSRRNK